MNTYSMLIAISIQLLFLCNVTKKKTTKEENLYISFFFVQLQKKKKSATSASFVVSTHAFFSLTMRNENYTRIYLPHFYKIRKAVE